MHDIRYIRKNPTAFDEAMARRGIINPSQEILSLDKKIRAKQQEFENLQAQAKSLAKQIGLAKANKTEPEQTEQLLKQSVAIKQQIDSLKKATTAEDEDYKKLQHILSCLPQILLDDVPDGKTEADNKIIKIWGDVPSLPFPPKSHIELSKKLFAMKDFPLRNLDFEHASAISGSRFNILSGKLARLERALANFMMDIHTKEFGFEECSVPLLVRENAMFGTSQLPKFREDAFETLDGFFLIPTGEIPLTNIVRDKIINTQDLPIKLCATTQCFRREAGAAGKDTQGMIRQHQFLKTELVTITTAEKAETEHEFLTSCAEAILEKLQLPYRKMLLCVGDTGFASQKTYDIEVFLPSQNKYREISSCSWFADFQARRMNARHRAKGQKQTEFLHTINGSGLAIGRTIIALMENFQQQDGSIRLPKSIAEYTGFDVI